MHPGLKVKDYPRSPSLRLQLCIEQASGVPAAGSLSLLIDKLIGVIRYRLRPLQMGKIMVAERPAQRCMAIQAVLPTWLSANQTASGETATFVSSIFKLSRSTVRRFVGSPATPGLVCSPIGRIFFSSLPQEMALWMPTLASAAAAPRDAMRFSQPDSSPLRKVG